MASEIHAGAGVDLEKELSCSICTDVLYQPLTLLDCLHTFCGSCLKEWFSWQATSTTHSSRVSPYTCPSCRAVVRAARPNANVSTLLDMFLKVNPGKGKTEAEKAEMREHYTPGDNVIPPVVLRADQEDSEDERLLDAVRAESVADLDPAVDANRRTQTTFGGEHGRTRQRHAANARQRQEALDRNVAHQPSLRSLLSASGRDGAELQDIIDNILASDAFANTNTDSLSPEQEEELIEGIAAAYIRRHPSQARSAPQQASSRPSTGAVPAPRQRDTPTGPLLTEQWGQEPTRARRSAEQRRRTSPDSRSRGVSSTVVSGSEAVLSSPPRSTTDRIANRSANELTSQDLTRSTNNSYSNVADVSQPEVAAFTDTTDTRASEETLGATVIDNSQTSQIGPRSQPRFGDQQGSRAVQPSAITSARVNTTTHPTAEPMTPYNATTLQHRAQSRLAPVVTCQCCEKSNIQYDLHYHCNKCDQGRFDLCLRCYRAGQGCRHWYGFGYGALNKWHRAAPPDGWSPNHEPPHVLLPRRYTRDTSELQEGAFCERCFAYADSSYWHCNVCLEGAWGFCLACVQQERHCSHPLAPSTRIVNDIQRHQVAAGVLTPLPMPHLPQNSYIFHLADTSCAVCGRGIPASHTRLHCSKCSDGNHDICNDSYRSLEATGKIRPDDGLSGARLCLQGHPMSILAYRNVSETIKQRIVVSEAVGGHDANYGPGGIPHTSKTNTLRCRALWSWWPAEGIDDELAFPKFAEIREVEQINSDYYYGVYAGAGGLFPANHVQVL